MIETSATWVPPQGPPGYSPNFTMRGVLSCQNIRSQAMSMRKTKRKAS